MYSKISKDKLAVKSFTNFESITVVATTIHHSVQGIFHKGIPHVGRFSRGKVCTDSSKITFADSHILDDTPTTELAASKAH